MQFAFSEITTMKEERVTIRKLEETAKVITNRNNKAPV